MTKVDNASGIGPMPRIAVVVQRYGEEVNGGAELHARWIAERLLAFASVEVITSCAVEYTTWDNHYPPGSCDVNGVSVRRFAVDSPRNWPHEQAETGRMVYSEHTVEEEIQWVKNQGPYSTPLLEYIAASADQFDVFIFFTYGYATTFFGLPLVAHKALLVPTAHEEPYLYFPAYKRVFTEPRGIIYNTHPEQVLVNRVMGNRDVASDVVGVGINRPPEASAARFREKYAIGGEFVLYVGRVDKGKNVEELIAHYLRYVAETGSDRQLILLGRAQIDIPEHQAIRALGFVSEQDKFDALAAARLVIMPSLFESLSMIALEAWLMETPMLVNGRCEVLRYQCQQSNGGLYYQNYFEFRVCLERMLGDDKLCGILGRQGRAFAEKNYNWDTIMAKYRRLIAPLL